MKKKGDLHADQYLVESVFNSEIIDQFGAQLWEDYKAVKTDGQAHALEKLVRMYEALHEGNPFCLLFSRTSLMAYMRGQPYQEGCLRRRLFFL